MKSYRDNNKTHKNDNTDMMILMVQIRKWQKFLEVRELTV